ncbi:MAG: N-acetylmuramoyl-L-alanine amidase [Deltaproteobacteria bacterium]|nr:N-acetylmuramoyl-L-alanine amidase [Deltaproteobacteria bacterium]
MDLRALGLTTGPGPGRVRAVQCWHNDNRLRLVLFLSSPQRYTNGVLAPMNGKPARLYLDVSHIQWSSVVERRVKSCAAGPVARLRIGRGSRQRMRVVFDLKAPTRYRILAFAAPFRILVDLMSASSLPGVNRGHKIQTVAIDPGHGGQSRGAVGPGHTMEKDVVLAVARRLAGFLRRHGIRPVMTRTRDMVRSLDDRTAIAFAAGADLFVSIHANAEGTGRRQAVETYYLDTASDAFAGRLADRENAVANGPITATRFRRAFVTETRLTKRSAVLARLTHQNVLSAVRRFLPETKDGHVRRALFYVLLTARMPAILVELSYITNKDAEQRLRSARVQQSLAEAIGRGILAYKQRQRRQP